MMPALAWTAAAGTVFAIAGGSAGARVASGLSQRAVSSAAAVAACAVIAVWTGFAIPDFLRFVVTLALSWCLLVLATVDALSFRLPNALTWPLIAGGFAALFLLGQFDQGVIEHLIGAVAGYGTFAAIAWGYHAWRGREGLGLGDAKLLAAAGAWLGWAPLPSVVLIACAAAFIWVAAEAWLRRRRSFDGRIPYGSALCLAIWIVWLYKPLLTY